MVFDNMATHIEYQSLITFMQDLRAHFIREYPIKYKAGQIYKGNKEISFFTFTPTMLQRQKLKIAIVFNMQQNRFEIWLAGQNREIQKKYWSLFKSSNWNKYHIPDKMANGFSIVDHILVNNPNFKEPDKLTLKVESGVMKFISDIVDVFKV